MTRPIKKPLPLIVGRPALVMIDFQLDRQADVHCIEGQRLTEIAAEDVDFRPGDCFISKRRYSVEYLQTGARRTSSAVRQAFESFGRARVA